MKRLTAVLSVVLLAVTFLALSNPLFAGPIPANNQGDAPEQAPALTLAPSADAYVAQATPAVNFGTAQQLRVDGSPLQRSYLRFVVQGLTSTVSQAILKVYANSALTSGYSAYRVASNSWAENTITFANAPVLGAVLGATGPVKAGTWTSIDVTAFVGGNGTYSLGLATASVTALSLASRESANKPQLIISTSSLPTPTLPLPTATRAAPTATSVPPTATRTATAVPPTPTRVPPTATAVPPTPTRVSPTATPGGVPYQPAAPIRAAFFYPWFPQAWTQKGIFPYTNYTPSLGYYSSTDDAIIDRQITLATQAHLDVFISSWWGQGHHTDLALQHIIPWSERAGSPNPNLRWSLYYENESQGDPTVAQIVSDLQYLAGKVFGHPGYLKVNGRPVVFVYSDGADACGMADRWAQAKAAVGGSVYIVLKVFPGFATCASQPDSWHQYSPAVGYDQQGKFSAVAAPGFWLIGNPVRLVRDPVRFEADVKKVVASGAFWQLITTWNEWGEGTSVEPANEWGNTYIDILTRNLPAR